MDYTFTQFLIENMSGVGAMFGAALGVVLIVHIATK